MTDRKQTKKYYFSVEGETEFWYLKWLQEIINNAQESKYRVTFDCSVQKTPLKRAKSVVITGKTEIYHFSDYESNEKHHSKEFQETLNNLKRAKSIGKQIVFTTY